MKILTIVVLQTQKGYSSRLDRNYAKMEKRDEIHKFSCFDIVFATLDCVIKAAAELFDMLEGEVLNKDLHQEASILTEAYPGKKLPAPLCHLHLMLNQFRKLKDKIEGPNLPVKLVNMRKMQLGGSSNGKEGLAASLAELTKRLPYFLQIEEDVQKYENPILNLIIAINSFQTNDMVKLLNFRNNFEAVLGVLTDESQVLAKFEGFPTKKLKTLRTAATLYFKLDRYSAP
ncbi:hypothetical protein RCOM_1018580 [Ricinus communis]|uniref:Uncharacterized protein n=1 Tax=Ricinus communis TaxID=3988 RepID=B9RWE3_RICCO|nr:hypothetical protein RCOM_1018580 [Ricinus communis]